MTNAPSERDDHYARRRDAYRPSTEANVPLPHDRGSTNPYDRHISPDHGRQPHHRLPSHIVPPRHFDSPRQEAWLRQQEPASSLSHHRSAAEDTQRSQRVVHLGSAYYSDHHPRESGFGFQPSTTNYYGQSKDQRQSERPERVEETNIRPWSRWEVDKYETSHRATRQRSMHPNIVPSGQTLPPEHSAHYRRHDSSYNHAPPRHSSHTYGIPAEDARYMPEDRHRRAHYPDEYRGHVDFRNATHRSEVEHEVLRYTQEQVRSGFLPHLSQVSNAERQRRDDAQWYGNARQSSWETSPAPHADWNHHEMRERRMGSRGPHEKEERMVHHDRESSRYREAPPAYEETVTYARDRIPHDDGRMTGIARQRSEAESGRAQPIANDEEAKKQKAMDFAVESFERGELDDVLNCGSPYLEQAARLLLQQLNAAEAAKPKTHWRAKPVLKPVRAASATGPFVQSDEDEDGDDDEEVTPSGTASGRNPEQDGSSTTVEPAAPNQATPSSGAVKSKLLRERARRDTPIRATEYEDDIGSIFEGSSAPKEQEPLFVPKTTPVKQKHSDLGSAADLQQDVIDSPRRQPSPDTGIVHDQNPKPSTPSNAAPTPFSMMSREQMAKMMAERNRATEVINPKPQIPQIAKTTQPPLAEIGHSRERAISISSEKSESDSSSDEHKNQNGDAEDLTAAQRRTKEFTRALEMFQSSGPSSIPDKSTTARNTESTPKSTTHIPPTAATTPALKLDAPPKASAASGQPSGWQAATAIVQELPAATNVKTPNAGTSASSNAKSPEESGMQSEDSKTQDRERQQTLESFGEDIMALRAEMERQKQQKREAEDQIALPESDNDYDDQGEGPQIDTVPKVIPKRRGRPPGSTSKKTADKKPAKPVKRKAPAKQLSSELVATESDEPDSDVEALTQTAVQRRGQNNGTLAHNGPISLHNYALQKRKPEESASTRVKKRKTSHEQEQPGKLRFDSEGNRHGLPALESPIGSPEMKTFFQTYGGDTHAMKAHAPICAQVLADEMDRDDEPEPNGNLRSPRLKRTTPPPKPINTSSLRPAYRKGKAWPEAVHVPVEDQDELEEPAAKPVKRRPKTPRKTSKQSANAPSTDAGVPEDHDGIIMVNKKFESPPTNQGAHCIPLGEADKHLAKWRSAGLKWDDVRILYANETNRILAPQTLQYRHKRVLEKNPDLAAAAAMKTDVPPPDDAPVHASAEEYEEEAEPPKHGPGGKTWNMDALEAYYANQRELNAYFASGEDETDDDDEPAEEEQEPRRQQPVREKTPEALDKNDCWWMYQVWRKSWTKTTEEDKKAMRKERKEREKEKATRAEMRKKEKEMRREERELEKQEKEAEKMKKKELQDMLSLFPGPSFADQDEGSETMSESDSDSDSGSDTESEGEEVDVEEVDPKEAAKKYVPGEAYYHTLKDANDAAIIEMCGSRFGIGGIGPIDKTGLISHTSTYGPHGMIELEAHYFNNVVVRVWVDRFVRAPGVADPPDVSRHGWLAKMIWVVKRKDVEVRRTRPANIVEAADGNAMDVEAESNTIAITDLATFTVLDGANSDAAQRALDHAYPPSQRGVDQIQARIDAKKEFDAQVQHFDQTNTTFSAGFEGDEEVVAQVAGEHGSSGGDVVVTTKRVETTFWVEGAMLQGPRNV
ncbi:hypothetical protein IWX90DRAFT_294498 [Phyllosticta citrichinensis]|uniref:Uncharacterized protein n=1 Tax=Phyllosticta citrichinensis TaxID=1130410 RepID=A0ABR1XKA5_9PEZI